MNRPLADHLGLITWMFVVFTIIGLFFDPQSPMTAAMAVSVGVYAVGASVHRRLDQIEAHR